MKDGNGYNVPSGPSYEVTRVHIAYCYKSDEKLTAVIKVDGENLRVTEQIKKLILGLSQVDDELGRVFAHAIKLAWEVVQFRRSKKRIRVITPEWSDYYEKHMQAIISLIELPIEKSGHQIQICIHDELDCWGIGIRFSGPWLCQQGFPLRPVLQEAKSLTKINPKH